MTPSLCIHAGLRLFEREKWRFSIVQKLSNFVLSKNIVQFFKYLLASVISLFFDYIVYIVSIKSNLFSIPQSASIGYLSGLIISYYLISNKVFKEGWLRENRLKEKILFAISGLLGVLITYASSFITLFLKEENVHLIKLFAIINSFTGVYLFRKFIVFKKN